MCGTSTHWIKTSKGKPIFDIHLRAINREESLFSHITNDKTTLNWRRAGASHAHSPSHHPCAGYVRHFTHDEIADAIG